MNLGAGQEQTHRCGEWTWGHGEGEGWAGTRWESSTARYTLPNVK